MLLQLQPHVALHSFQRPGHVVRAIQILCLQISPLLEIFDSFVWPSEPREHQASKVEASRVLRAANDGLGEHAVRPQIILREVSVDTATVHLPEHGVLCRQRRR